ncbi:hypothetical protein [Pseudoalteromonas tunicata]|jgi:mRNA-degrading endonuclease RelE of RelBE toxin-antitoxin system|uniref:Uncharacterized protein n=1 Tax=Pseudoalteromonas tunicata D2 TaxID=87626 RepID=A4CAV0_9GAMM|nr:hypothetical protein [Pseudoalteromonas tunicata]ATC95054.1 hypothetical protein PTUN_a2594 [Pseudoalteromonas tunicata]AXT30701.1 hypothetical protein D1819_07630 [Pseudoalteromonas tunicata]EAR28508.1 hypothetical protein PTD2_21872 [Pseudoalteromonas tunicata D2]
MNLLVSEKCASELKKDNSKITLYEVSQLLQTLEPKTFKSRPDVKKVQDSEQEIYVLKYKSMRMFFTFSKDEDLVLMSTSYN